MKVSNLRLLTRTPKLYSHSSLSILFLITESKRLIVVVIALRLYPPVASNDRQAVKDTFLPVGGGPDGSEPIFIPKGTRILFYPYSMHRREDVFGPDTDDFKPERWEGLRPGWGFLPFHGGPRACPGRK